MCIAAMLLAAATAWGWGETLREKVIDGRTFSYRFYWNDNGYTNVSIYAISPQDGDIVIPARIDDTDNVGLGSITIGYSQHHDIAGPGTTSVHLPPSATGIPAYCFQGCANLTNINLECVTWFGMFAFDKCSNLVTTVHVKTNTYFEISSYRSSLNQSYTFRDCVSLKDVIIDEGVKSLGGIGVFSGCGIESVKLPSTLQSMNSTFVRTPLREIDIPDSVKDIGGAFGGCTNLVQATIGRGIESLDQGDFNGCTSLERIVFKKPSALVKINGGFARCTNLTEVEIPDGVVSLDNSTFQYCTKLAHVTLPDTLRLIGYATFWGCAGLKTIDIPSGVTNIADSAFTYSGLVEAVLPEGLQSIGSSAFSSCKALRSVTIPSTVTSIGNGAFGYTALRTVVVPDSVQGTLAVFSGCTNLESVVIGNGITTLGGFSDCYKLGRIVVPNSVTNISGYAFKNYGGEIVLGNPTPSLGYQAFSYSSPAKITCLGGLPTPSNYMAKNSRIVVTSEYLHEWLPWLVENKVKNYAVLDETTQEEICVILDERGLDSVGVMSALGIAAARGMDANGATATYAMPELSIASFDPSAGRVEVAVKPAAGCTVSAGLVSACVAVEGSNDLKQWNSVEASVGDERYVGTGKFVCTFNASTYRFYKVKVSPRN